MRRKYQRILKEHFRKHLIEVKEEHELTQEEMAERLEMSVRSFADLKSGKSSCSALTLMLFMIYCCNEPTKFLEEFKKKFEEEKNGME